MTTREQIEADAALARRLQEEEFGSPVFFRAAPPSPHTPPNSAPPRTVPGAPRQTRGYERMGPRQPTPPLPPRQTHPYAQGSPNYSSGDMLSELFRRAGEPFPTGVPDALENLREFGDFPGRGYVLAEGDRRRHPSSRTRNAAPPSPEMLMESFFGNTMGPGDRGRSSVRSGSFIMTPQGLTRVEFPLQNARNGDRAREETQRQQRHSHSHSHSHSPRHSSRTPHQHPRGVPRYPQPQRYPQPDEVHQHHIFQRGDGDTETFHDIGEMLNEVFSDMFTAFNRDRMPGGARAGAAGFGGGIGGNLMEYLQSVLPGVAGMNGEPRQYEDWLQFIDRMGHVNRGATESEINRLPSEKFDKKMLERVRMKRRQREGRSSGNGSKSGGSSAAGPSSKTGDEAEKCAICLGEYESGEEVKTLPCFHVFHTECVDRWLKVNKICPFCKKSIRPGDGDRA